MKHTGIGTRRIYVFIALLIVGLISTACLPNVAEDLDSVEEQPYGLLHNKVTDEHTIDSLLIVTSADPQYEEDYASITTRNNYLAQIIESHWDVDVDVMKVDEYEKGDINDYDALFLVEERDRVPIDLLSDMVGATDKEIIISGYGAGNFVSHITHQLWSPESEAALTEVPPLATSVSYKDVTFSSNKLQLLSEFPPLPQTASIERETPNTFNLIPGLAATGNEAQASECAASGADGAGAAGAGQCVMVVDTVPIRQQPDITAPQIGVANAGEMLEVISVDAFGWVKVRPPEAFNGFPDLYVSGNDVESSACAVSAGTNGTEAGQCVAAAQSGDASAGEASEVSDGSSVKVLATYVDDRGETHPLVVDINERYLILPFELPYYYSPDDYTLVFLDVLHNALGHHEPTRFGLVRLEDVNPYTYRSAAKLRDAYEFLKGANVPFQVAVIARYIYPDKRIDLEMNEARRYTRYLTRMEGEGLGTLVQHGYTHQATGISGIDYEFWDPTTNSPLSYDSEDYVYGNLRSAQAAMRFNKFPVPDIFETPHYALSDLDNAVVNRYYPLRYEHIPEIGSLPFVAMIDNRIYFPTNLGYVAKWDDIEPEQKAELLTHVSVFEDPIASFFWHPWRDVSELEYMVNLLRGQGYEFVSVYDLVDTTDAPGYAQLAEFRANYDSSRFIITNAIIDALLVIVYVGFSIGSLLYARNIYLIWKYFRQVDTSTTLKVEDLRELAAQLNRELPNLAILVPARNEGYVIGNTVRRLIALDYPKEHYRVFIIVDERELDDNVEVLTKSAAHGLAAQVRADTGIDLVQVIEVPQWYSGEYGNLSYSNKKSTKGRALNYALEHLATSPDWQYIELLGILDADGRLSPHVLKEVAYKRMKNGSKLLQGSVFQVSNYDQVSVVGVAAGLELAVHHLTVLPSRMQSRKVQFLAGTNYFIDRDIVTSVKGWDQTSLVEDAELALRIYVEQDVKAEWISSPELEQSPANFSVYRRQRERWARGHLKLLKDISKSNLPLMDKLTFYSKIFLSQFRFILDLVLLVLGLALVATGALGYIGQFFKWLSIFLALMSVLIFDMYGHMYRKLSSYIDPGMDWKQKLRQSLKLFSYFPILVLVQAIPRVDALRNFAFGRDRGWYKTERTKEAAIDAVVAEG